MFRFFSVCFVSLLFWLQVSGVVSFLFICLFCFFTVWAPGTWSIFAISLSFLCASWAPGRVKFCPWIWPPAAVLGFCPWIWPPAAELQVTGSMLDFCFCSLSLLFGPQVPGKVLSLDLASGCCSCFVICLCFGIPGCIANFFGFFFLYCLCSRSQVASSWVYSWGGTGSTPGG